MGYNQTALQRDTQAGTMYSSPEAKKEAEQRTLDIVWAHSRHMTKQSLHPDTGQCMYRAPDGNMCFYGVLIPDWLYEKEFEGIDINSCLHRSDALYKYFKEQGYATNNPFMSELQSIHDTTCVFPIREEALTSFAVNRSLRLLPLPAQAQNELENENEGQTSVDTPQV